MTFIKLLFLLLLILPFAVFLLFIVDKLMDDIPHKDHITQEDKAGERNINITDNKDKSKIKRKRRKRQL